MADPNDMPPQQAQEAAQEPITGRVAKILNSRELVINRGADHGVEVGMQFDVLDAKAENIRDPETGEDLGAVDRPKVQVQVSVVQDQLSVARTYKSHRVNVGGSGFSLSRTLMPPRYVHRYQTLKTDESTWEDLDEAESYVKTGDPVRQVVTRSEEEEAESLVQAAERVIESKAEQERRSDR